MAQHAKAAKTSQREPSKRSRMDRLLSEALEKPLVILSAGSGHGKTHAVASFVSRQDERVFWIHLSELANYTVHFWKLYVQAVNIWNPKLAAVLQAAGFPDSPPAVHRFLEGLASEAYSEKRIIMVFDDFHCLREGPVRSFILRLIQAYIENLSVILISGSEVSISILGSIPTARVTDRQLRFTREEIRVYYTALGIEPSDDLLDRIHNLTEGWAFAVNMLGMHLQKNETLSHQDIDYAVSHLFRLVKGNLLDRMTPEIHRAMTLLSLLEEFTLEMAAALTGQEARALREALGGLDLVSLRPETSTIYFHGLLKRVLDLEAEALTREARDDFLARAGRWLEEHGMQVQAVRLYARCEAWAEIYRLMLRQGAARVGISLARDWLAILDRFPEEFGLRHPMLRVIRANLLDCCGKGDAGMRELRSLQSVLVQGRDEETDRVLGESYALLAFLCMKRGNYSFVRYVKAADGLLPGGSGFLTPDKRLSCGNGNAMVYSGPQPGELVNMLAALREAMPHSDRVFGGLGAGVEDLAAAELFYYQGAFKEAEAFAYKAAFKAESCCQWDIVCNSYYILMRVKIACGKPTEVEQAQLHIREYAAKSDHPAVATIPEIAESGFYLKIGQSSRVAGWIRDNALAPYRSHRGVAGREVVVRAGYMVSVGEYYEALLFIESSLRACRETGQWFSGLKLQILKAITYDRLGDVDTAARMLERAWRTAQGSHIIMPFAEYGNDMRSLIRHVRHAEKLEIPSDWLDLIGTKANTYAKYQATLAGKFGEKYGDSASVLSQLTKRERQVLTLVCQGLKNEEIAQELELQPSTVKGTLNRIYPKLHAINRADAVRIAIGELS